MNDNDQSIENTRKPYEKPEAKRFPLRPEEAVLGFCKSTTSAGPSGGTCLTVTFCQTAGS
jgi:hypothetical protein